MSKDKQWSGKGSHHRTQNIAKFKERYDEIDRSKPIRSKGFVMRINGKEVKD